MKTIAFISIAVLTVPALILSSCSKEDPFTFDPSIFAPKETTQEIPTESVEQVSPFQGWYIKTYNRDPKATDGMGRMQPIFFGDEGEISYDDPWDYGNSIHGNWSWLSDTEIHGTYLKGGQTDKYSFKASLEYDVKTDLPRFTGFWYEGEAATPGTEKGHIAFYYDKDAEFFISYSGLHTSEEEAIDWDEYPQIYYHRNYHGKDRFGGWFTAYFNFKNGSFDYTNSKSYKIYFGTAGEIFRGKKKEVDKWTWISENEIQGTFIDHSDYAESEDRPITFTGKISYDENTGFPVVKGSWYYGKEVNIGSEAGDILINYQDWSNLVY